MGDIPIIFSAPMIRALLDGRKTMTRRLPTPTWRKAAPGDRLWVRENWQALSFGDYLPTKTTPADPRYAATDPLADLDKETRGYPWRPSIHMPRWASRLTLVVTATKIESLDRITGTDAIAEGLASLGRDGENWHWDPQAKPGDGYFAPWRAFKALWESLHGPASWDARPVVAITFTVHKRNIDDGRSDAT
jgi:hypothetical protein